MWPQSFHVHFPSCSREGKQNPTNWLLRANLALEISKNVAEQQQKKKSTPLIIDELSICSAPVMKWNWTSFLIHSSKPQCRFYQKQIWRPCGAPWVSLNLGPTSSLKLICLVCLGKNHNRSGSIACVLMKKMYWPFPCLIRVTRGDKSHKTQYFLKRVPNLQRKLTALKVARLPCLRD